MRKLRYFIATFFWSGFVPFAPGTAGSLLAAAFYWFLPLSSRTWLIIILIAFGLGIWVSEFMEKERGPDPGLVVIDEAAGQWLTYLFLPKSLLILGSGFLIFRIFDIWKPFPINKSQNLPAGWGIMSDDILAGVYANLTLQLLIYAGVLL